MKTLVIFQDDSINKEISDSLLEAGISSKDVTFCTHQDSEIFLNDFSLEFFLIEVPKGAEEDSFLLIEKIKRSNPVAQIATILNQKDPDLILNLVKKGCGEFITKPLKNSELSSIISKFSQSPERATIETESNLAAEKANVISVLSYKGGTGVTTVSTNLAFCLSELESIRSKTLLLDLANQSNHCSMLLAADSGGLNINQIYRDIDSIESGYLFSTCSWLTENLALIGTDPGLDGVQPMEFDALNQAINLLSEVFEYIVIDVPTHTFDNRFLASIENSNQVIVVSTMDITSIRDTRLMINILKNLQIDNSKIRLLINRYFSKGGIFKSKDLEVSLQYPISFYLPNDFVTIMKAAESGEAILEFSGGNTAIGDAYCNLAEGISKGATFVPIVTDSKQVTPKKTSPVSPFGGLFQFGKKKEPLS